MATTFAVSNPSAASATRKLHLFSVYMDFPASVQARSMICTITQLAQQAGPEWLASSEMWKLDALKSSDSIRQMMTKDAANADVIIITVTSLVHHEPALIDWLAALAAEKTNQSGLLIGLFGDDKTQSKELDWIVKPLLYHARQMGREVIWHCLEQNIISEVDWLKEHLENLLTNKLAAENSPIRC